MSLEGMLFWVAVVGYALAMLSITAGLVFKRGSVADASFWLTVTAYAAHTGSIITRWISSGRLPFVQDYENLLSGTWAIVLVYLIVAVVWKHLRPAAIGVLPFVLLSMGWAVTLPSEPGPVTPPYRSIWLAVHVLFAWATYAGYTSAAGLGILSLLKSGRRPAKEGSPIAKVPDASRLDEITFRLVAFGFIVNALMIASGAIWAYELWGSYWRWDPVETWSLLTWVAYGFYLHASLTLGWRGRRLAWVAVLALFGVMMAFWGVQFAPTSYHLFRSIGEVPGVDRF